MALSRVVLAIFAACIVCVISADLRERAQELEDGPLERQRRSSYGYGQGHSYSQYGSPGYHRSSYYTYYPGYSRGYGGYGSGYGYGGGYGNGYGYGGSYGGYRGYH